MNNNSPIAVFDSGVGSYSIVRVLREMLSNEHYVYLADRASFPYGGKAHRELKEIILRTIRWFEEHYEPKLIVIASNTPSIQVLDEIKPLVKTKIIGVFPPIEEAASVTKTKHIAILATKGAVQSSEIGVFIKSKNLPGNIIIHKVNASDLVNLVEPGTFQNNPQQTEKVIRSIIDPLLSNDKDVDVMTLSSTHLPFLLGYLQRLYPNISFLDPAEIVAKEVENYLREKKFASTGSGSITILTTKDKEGKLGPEGLQAIFKNLGLNTQIQEVSI